MNAKRLLALALSVIMVLAMIPVVTLVTTAADDEHFNLWTTNREADEKGAELYRPKAGYEYTADGFQAGGADFTGTNPFLNIETNKAVNIKDGLYMEVRIDEFSYRGYSNADEWISFNIWTTTDRALSKGPSTGYGEGYLNLLRSGGNGGAAGVENYYMSDETGFTMQAAGPIIEGKVGEDGKEVWTFQIIWDEDNGYYTFLVNGVIISEDNNPNLNLALQEMNSEGMFYAGVTLHSAQKNGKAAATVIKYGNTPEDARTPDGTDYAAAEINPYDTEWVLADPSTVPENTPAVLFDATNSSMTGPKGTNMTLTANDADNSYHVSAAEQGPFSITWAMKKDVSYDAADFPVFAMLVKNLWCNAGNIYFCAGETVAPSTDHLAVWSQYDDNASYYIDGEGNEYTLVAVDFADRIEGRLHSLRVDFDSLDTSDPEFREFDVMYMGMFRSKDEAIVYTEGRFEDLAADTEEDLPEDDGADESSDESGEESSEAASGDDTAEGTGTTSESGTEGGEATTAEEKSGCGSVVGLSAAAILLSAAAAAVVLKKRD